MERRQFLTWIGLGFLVTTGPATIASCQSESITQDQPTTAPLDVPSPPQEVSSTAEATPEATQGYSIGTLADLDAKGVLSGKPDFVDATVLVIRDPNSPDTLRALNATCPHNQCEVEWDGNSAQFICPCHEGKFSPDGAVVAEPPTSNLIAYQARIEGDQVIVSQS
jgi:cytochrome b6-f complex iron-sulfur subunit